MRSLHIAENFYDFVTEVRPEEVKQVQKCLRMIKEDPSNPGLRRHKLLRIKSKHVVSYSPNQDIRIIAYEPTNDESYLLFVGHHDDAYNWAENRRIDVDAISKVLKIARIQVEDIDKNARLSEIPAVRSAVDLEDLLPARVRGESYFFDALSDDELSFSDIPKVYHPVIRKVKHVSDVMFLLDRLPQTVGEALFALADRFEGKSIDKVEEPATAVTAEPQDAVDEVVQFKTIQTDEELQGWIDDLEKALSMPFKEWQKFLHPAQRKAVQARSKGALRVTGAAGTGKTVVGIHRAKHLAESDFRKVFFVTYNRTLMNNLLGLVKDVFWSGLGTKFHLNTFHGFVAERLSAAGLELRGYVGEQEFLGPGLEVVSPDDFGGSWQSDSIAAIYREVTQVIAPQRLTSLKSYVRAPRKGLAKALTVKQKEAVWRVYEAAWAAAKKARSLPFDLMSHFALESNLPVLDGAALVVDEVQDLQATDLAFLAQQAPGANQLTLLEDARQRIYGTGYSLKALGINVTGRRSVKLFINYRTTAEIGQLATKSLDQLDLAVTDWPRPLRSGRPTEVRRFTDSDDERAWLMEKIHDCQKRGFERIAVLARARRHLEALEPRLADEGLEYMKIDRNHSLSEPGVISLCTMHSSKGLEFEVVFVIGIDYGAGGLNPPANICDDKVLVKDFERKEKHLLYVALSRARDELYVSGKGEALESLMEPKRERIEPILAAK